MVLRHFIGTYKVVMLGEETGRSGGYAGFVYFYAPSGDYLGFVCGVRDGWPVPQDRGYATGIVHAFVREAEMLDLILMLRSDHSLSLLCTDMPSRASNGARNTRTSDTGGMPNAMKPGNPDQTHGRLTRINDGNPIC